MVEYLIFLGAMALSYGVAVWVGNLRRGEDLTSSLSHGPAVIVLLLGFLAVVGGGSWVIRVLFRAILGP